MSRGPGKVERALEAIFLASSAAHTVRELTRLVYGKHDQFHENTVRLALKRLDQRMPLIKGDAYLGGQPGRNWTYRSK